MATIKEIAKECNVSIATVSNILNNKGKVSEATREMVLKQIQKNELCAQCGGQRSETAHD